MAMNAKGQGMPIIGNEDGSENAITDKST